MKNTWDNDAPISITGILNILYVWSKDPNIEVDIDPGSFYETKVSSSSIKALTKISSMSNYSIIKIISFRDGLLRLNHKIGDFGEHNIYLIDNS